MKKGIKQGWKLITLLFLLAACTTDEELNTTIQAAGGEKELSFTLQTAAGVTTRAMNEAAEDHIGNIYILAFRVGADGAETFDYMKKASAITGDGSTKTVTFNARTDEEAQQRFVVIANAEDEVRSLPGGSQAKDDLLAGLVVRNEGIWNAGSATDFQPIPMWGESQPMIVTAGTTANIPLTLTRMLARIDIELTDPAKEQFRLENVYLYNPRSEGCIVPNTTAAYWQDGKAVKPTVPPGSKTVGGGLEYDVTEGESLRGAIYTFESAASASKDEATCLVIGGTYKGAKSYYRVDFTDAARQPKDLLRNYRYQVSISGILGEGSPTPGEAFRSEGVNMIAEVLEWNEGDISNIVAEGKFMLGISQTQFRFTRQWKDNNILYVTTNYPDGWTYEITDQPSAGGNSLDPANGWLRVNTRSYGNTGSKDSLAFYVDQNTSGGERRAYIRITAGRLTNVVEVVQTASDLPVIRFSIDPLYPLNGELASASVYSDYPWKATLTDGDVIQYLETAEGQGAGLESDGEPLTFYMKGEDADNTGDDHSIIVVYSESGAFQPATIDIEANVAGYDLGNIIVDFNDRGMVPYQTAVETCAALGEGWRLPTLTEFNELREDAMTNINLVFQPNTNYWSSDPADGENLYVFKFNDGGTYPNNPTGNAFVRCVRDK